MIERNASRFAQSVYWSAFNGARSKIGRSVLNGTDAGSIAADVVITSLQMEKEAQQRQTEQHVDSTFYKNNNWAYGVGKWRAVDALRKEKVIRDHTPLLSKKIEDLDNRPEELAMTIEQQRMVQQGLLSLGFQDAVYLFCRHWMGLSNKEVAEFWAELTGEHLSERAHGLRFKNAADRLRRRIIASIC